MPHSDTRTPPEVKQDTVGPPRAGLVPSRMEDGRPQPRDSPGTPIPEFLEVDLDSKKLRMGANASI